MNETRLKNVLIHFEGNKQIVYADTMGYPTAGIGHMDRNMIIGQNVSPSMIDMFYKQDVLNAINTAKAAVGLTCFNVLDEGRQINLIQLCFNLGNKIKEFVHLIAAIKNAQWDQAATELKNSLWYSQVGIRGVESAQCFIHGHYSWE